MCCIVEWEVQNPNFELSRMAFSEILGLICLSKSLFRILAKVGSKPVEQKDIESGGLLGLVKSAIKTVSHCGSSWF